MSREITTLYLTGNVVGGDMVPLLGRVHQQFVTTQVLTFRRLAGS